MERFDEIKDAITLCERALRFLGLQEHSPERDRARHALALLTEIQEQQEVDLSVLKKKMKDVEGDEEALYAYGFNAAIDAAQDYLASKNLLRVNTAGKGKCKRRACNNTAVHEHLFNHGDMYCHSCALKINDLNDPKCFDLVQPSSELVRVNEIEPTEINK